jgi:hypothetical protein
MSNGFVMLPLIPAAVSAPSGTAAGNAGLTVLDYMGLFWQSPGTIAQAQYDMGGNVSVDTVALLNLAGAPAGSFDIHYATAAQGAVMSSVGTGLNQFQVITVGNAYAGANALANGRQAGLWVGSSPIVARHFRVHLTGVTSGQCRFSRFVIGKRLTLSRNFSFGGQLGVRDFSRIDFSNRATLLRRRAPKLRTCSLTFPHVERFEVEEQVQPLIEMGGNDSAVLLVTDPDAHPMRTRRMYFGPMVGNLGLVQRNARGWQWQAELVSVF